MKKKLILWLIPVALMLASCHSSKKAAKDDVDKTKPTTTVVTPSTSSTTSTKTTPSSTTSTKTVAPKDTVSARKDVKVKIADGTNFTSKVRVNITQDGKNISTTGTLRMRYGDVIQLTLVDPVLGIAELGRMELSPDKMLIIDRVNKRYVDTPYSEFNALKSKNIDFATIQDFFWQEAQNSDELSYTIPAKTSIKLDLKLSGKGNASNWTAHTTVSDKYTKTDANKLFSKMVGQ